MLRLLGWGWPIEKHGPEQRASSKTMVRNSGQTGKRRKFHPWSCTSCFIGIGACNFFQGRLCDLIFSTCRTSWTGYLLPDIYLDQINRVKNSVKREDAGILTSLLKDLYHGLILRSKATQESHCRKSGVPYCQRSHPPTRSPQALCLHLISEFCIQLLKVVAKAYC